MRADRQRRRNYQRRRLKRFAPVRELGRHLRQRSGAKLTKELFELLEVAHSKKLSDIYITIYTYEASKREAEFVRASTKGQ